jgi:hypothetical protein
MGRKRSSMDVVSVLLAMSHVSLSSRSMMACSEAHDGCATRTTGP